MILKVLPFLMVFGILGCSTLSKTDCQKMNWQEKGRADGREGAEDPGSILQKYEKSCREHGYPPNVSAYNTGFAEGRDLFCQPQAGFEWGKRGQALPRFCPESESYQKSFQRGRAEFLRIRCGSLTSEISHMESDLAWTRSQRSLAETNLSMVQMTLPPDDLSGFSRESMAQSEISSYDGKISSLEMELVQKRLDLFSCESEISKLKETNP